MTAARPCFFLPGNIPGGPEGSALRQGMECAAGAPPDPVDRPDRPNRAVQASIELPIVAQTSPPSTAMVWPTT